MPYQVLDASKLKFYKPDQIEKDPKGGTAILLKEGVKPVAGTVKTIASANPGSLQGTLSGTKPSDIGLPSGVQTSVGSIDQLSALKMVLGNVEGIAKKSGLAQANTATLGGFQKAGFAPESMAGSTIADIVNFVSQESVRPIEQAFTQLSTVIDGIEKQRQNTLNQAKDQITQMVSSGMWDKLSDTQRDSLWTAAGYIGKAVKPKANLTFVQSEDDAGHVWNIGIDTSTGAVVSRNDLGKIGTATKSSGPKGDSPAEIEKDFKADLLDPSKIGVKKQIATEGQEGNDPDNYTTREELYRKLLAKWGNKVDAQYIHDMVYYEAYPDSKTTDEFNKVK